MLNINRVWRKLKKEGYLIIAIEQVSDSKMLHEYVPDRSSKYALVFGNEVFGVSDEIVDMADGCIEIPQLGTKHSLNIAVSVGIVIWDFYKKINHYGLKAP